MVAMGPDELNDFLTAAFPQAQLPMRVTRSDDDGVEVTWPYHENQLRPGGTLSGPTLMTLADTVAYVAVVAQIGPQFLTVTSHLDIDFLRKPPPADLRATGEVLKLGRRQAVVSIRIHSTADDGLVASSSCTYALPSTPPAVADAEEPAR
ncbi:MAG TPA: PaaI family thioesterase [Acidimicrobiales bacterium]|nr:PaaI family thioesterase [Acidimicrobiales bacterium]